MRTARLRSFNSCGCVGWVVIQSKKVLSWSGWLENKPRRETEALLDHTS